jgi:hypothetical protein
VFVVKVGMELNVIRNYALIIVMIMEYVKMEYANALRITQEKHVQIKDVFMIVQEMDNVLMVHAFVMLDLLERIVIKETV